MTAKKYEVWLANLDPRIGTETGKTRPVLIVQTDLLKELKKLGKPIVLVLVNGSALSINWEQENINAIVETWYGGEKAGAALADVLMGAYNPAGRLPVTFYRSINDLPAFDDYSMNGKTYRYTTKPVLYPFGYGLSYSNFTYSDLKLSALALDSQKPLQISCTVKNTGTYNGDEVVQLYIKQQGVAMPLKELKGFKRIHLEKGMQQLVTFQLKAEDIQHYSEQLDDLSVIPGKIELMIGASSADSRLSAQFELKKAKL